MMDNMTMRKHLLENVTKMLNWISEQFQKADCEVTFEYKFEYGFIYGHRCDYLEFCCNKNATFWFCHYGTSEKLKDGKLYEGDRDYTQSYLTNPNWYIPHENVKGFEAAMNEWPRAKAAILEHLEKVRNVANFEV